MTTYEVMKFDLNEPTRLKHVISFGDEEDYSDGTGSGSNGSESD